MTPGKHASGRTAASNPVEVSTPQGRRALTEPCTRRAVRRYLVRGFALLGASIGLFVLFALDVSFFDTPDTGIRTAIACTLGGIALFVLVIGLCVLLNSVRMTLALATHPWVVWDSRYREVGVAVTPNGEPTLYLGPNGEHVLTLVALRGRWAPFSYSATVWLAGSPRRGGVVSTPGGEYLVWCRRPIMRAVRNWLIRKGTAAVE